MTCDRIDEAAVQHVLDREASDAERGEVAGHVARCPACRRGLGPLLAVDGLLPSALAAGAARRPRRPAAMVGAAAAVAAAAAVVVAALVDGPMPPEPSAPAAEHGFEIHALTVTHHKLDGGRTAVERWELRGRRLTRVRDCRSRGSGPHEARIVVRDSGRRRNP